MTVQYRREMAIDGIVRYSTGMTNLISYIVHIKAGQAFQFTPTPFNTSVRPKKLKNKI